MTKILFIGNSMTYFNDMPTEIFAKLAENEGHKVAVTSITKGGRSLHGHLNKADELTAKVAEALSPSNRGGYDFVVLQEHSCRPLLNPGEFYTAARELVARIKAIDAKPVFYMRPSLRDGNHTIAENGLTYSGMVWGIAAAHEAIAAELGAYVAGALYAFYDVDANHPEIAIYKEDMGHPTYAGSYLAALTIYARIFGEDPANVKFDGQLDSATAEILRKAASKAVNAPPAIPDEYKISTTDV